MCIVPLRPCQDMRDSVTAGQRSAGCGSSSAHPSDCELPIVLAGPAPPVLKLAASTLRLLTRRSWWYGNCMARLSVLRVWRHQSAASVQVWGTSVGLGQGAEAGRKQANPRRDGLLACQKKGVATNPHRKKGNKRWHSVGEPEKRNAKRNQPQFSSVGDLTVVQREGGQNVVLMKVQD